MKSTWVLAVILVSIASIVIGAKISESVGKLGDFFVQFIATVIGVFLAFVLDRWWERRNEENKTKEERSLIMGLLADELEYNKFTLNKIIAEFDKNEVLIATNINYKCWNDLVNQSLASGDKGFYNKLSLLYKHLQNIDEMVIFYRDMICFGASGNVDNVKKLIQAKAKGVGNVITEVLKEIDEKKKREQQAIIPYHRVKGLIKRLFEILK